MKHSEFEDKYKYQEKLNPKEQDTIDYFTIVMKQKKEKKILAVTISILTVISLLGTGIGVYNLIKWDTLLAYLILVIIGTPLAFMLGGLTFLALNKKGDTGIRDETLNITSVSFLVFVLIGNCISVFYLIKLGAILAYFISGMIICVVLYLVFRVVKSKM